MTHPTMRTRLIDGVLEFLAAQDLMSPEDIRAALEREIDEAGGGALVALKERIRTERGWSYYEPDPLARRIHRTLLDRFLDAASRVVGVQQLEPLRDAPLVLVSNHLSYSDANVIEVLLHRAGAETIADRLTALAGPKVFTNQHRRFSSLCFGTVRVPQSAEVSSEEAILPARDVARAAREAILAAEDRLRAGDALLLFGEGTRSRTGAMRPLLPGVARYLTVSNTWVVPVGLTGSEALFPVGAASVARARAGLYVGTPFRASTLLAQARGDRRLAVDTIGHAIAELLPPAMQGAYADESAAARTLLNTLR